MPQLTFYILVFTVVGVFFLFIHLLMGHFIRPNRPESEKLTIYECGEPTVGTAWVQFDLRYYVVALLFVIFDVEVAFFFPWAVVFGNANQLAYSNLPKEKREQITERLTAHNAPLIDPDASKEIDHATAQNWLMVAYFDILVFFGVLMVGFAYLWKRGDIAWVRSRTSQEADERADAVPLRPETPTLVGAGH